ncbi:MAG: peptidoglycan DD-metalloendopeptidase family protein [Bacteroidia bacterium]|nr:peptidoglycan DD-metalloendopeptidase family protein [Bacteroidia bacterium]
MVYRSSIALKWILYLYILGFEALLCPLGSFAQNISKNRQLLEKERERIEQEVTLTNQLINETRNSRSQSLNDIALLKKQISLRERLISNIELDMGRMDVEIASTNSVVGAMEQDIIKIREQYGKMAYRIYKTQNNLSILLWILSAESFKQAYYRMMYFKEVSKYRSQQISLLRRAQHYLYEKKDEINTQKAQKEKLLGRRKQEADKLVQSKKDKDDLYLELRKKEREYREKLREHQKSLAQVQEAIEKIIREEIAKSKKADEKDILNPLSEQFEKNKGKLPWPLPSNKGVITETFGVNEVASGGKVNNNGVYISTSKDMTIRAIFSGKVTAVSTIPMHGKIIIIQHGVYRSVYANLKETSVTVGQEIDALQPIGIVKTEYETGDTKLHFLLYKDKTPIDPMLWIAEKN